MNLLQLFPVYNEYHAKFFVSPQVVAPYEVCYGENDSYERKPHISQFLRVPLAVPNYLGLCQVPGQKHWGVMDEIQPGSLRVETLLISYKKEGETYDFFISTKNMANVGFTPSPHGRVLHVLNTAIVNYPGFEVTDAHGEKAGGVLFSDFKDVGYEPLFWFAVDGEFNRQLNSLEIQSRVCGIRGVRNIETNEITHISDFSPDLLMLAKRINGVMITGVKMAQDLV